MTWAKHSARIDWIDYAKGICIVLVVMLYAVDWIEGAIGREGWLHRFVDFAKPFRMPDFFLVSGLLLSRTIQRDWLTYLDRKVVHFAYFYLLWLTISLPLMRLGTIADNGWGGLGLFYLHSLVRPYHWLWFIYLLPVFFVVTKLALRAPRILVWIAAAGLHLAQIESDVKVLDKFAQYYVFFYTGYALAPQVFKFADAVLAQPRWALAGLVLWAVFEGYAAFSPYAALPVASLALAFLGAAAVIAVAALMSGTTLFGPLRYCGANSIVVYLAFFIPAVLARAVLKRQDIVSDVGTLSLIATLAGVLGALVLYWVVRGTRLRFLFERPGWFRLSANRALVSRGA